ncbi:HIT zinc finger protein [Teratosphaeria destructans]|uniref:HIT zinc finger protein n=1 Tax=Teratosphaeria destructans TaxID=418781 RepID=A0A9W7T0H1_9PEZI|nr:HIT zinc finger protein [Teratosphaeria destructans]
MPEQHLLTNSCGICFAETPKYRCPGCQAQTCSLPCYKKHQQRTSCSGKRDPAAYLKKSQLATPAGLDRDYNYLKGVERSINHAGFEVEDRGIGVGSASSKNVVKGWQTHGRLQEYLAKHHILLERAPRGMSRQKANSTRVTKGGHIMWTVEWMTVTGSSGLQHDCLESNSLQTLYLAHTKAAAAREAQQTRPAKRQKTHHNGQSAPDRRGVEVLETETIATKEEVGTLEMPVEGRPLAQGQVEATEATQRATSPLATASHESREGSEASTTPTNHFYLLRPATASALRVLIPVRSDVTLTQTLEHHSVQEYPTIYVLDAGPESLPDGFTTESSYLAVRATAEHELRERVQGAKGVAGNHNDHGSSTQGPDKAETAKELDAQSVLDMLRRDMHR